MSAVTAGLAALIVTALLCNGGRGTGPPSLGLRETFGFDAAYADPDPMVLVIRYGDPSSCPSKTVRNTVIQEPDQVVVTLTRAAIPADRACTSDYGAKLVRISLNAPLGSRAVIDGSRKKPLPISTGLPPFGSSIIGKVSMACMPFRCRSVVAGWVHINASPRLKPGDF